MSPSSEDRLPEDASKPEASELGSNSPMSPMAEDPTAKTTGTEASTASHSAAEIQKGSQQTGTPPKRNVKTRTPRPDELSKETFEFITAVDDYKRNHMRSFLNDLEILNVLYSLGYGHPENAQQGSSVNDSELERFKAARLRYRDEAGRLFPTWSELFTILTELGYSREDLPYDEEATENAA